MGISTIWNIFFISALSQAVFVIFILLFKFFQSKQSQHLVLGIFIAVFSFILLNNLLYWNQLFETYPHFLFSTVSIRFLLAPLFFIYCSFFIHAHFKWQLKEISHFLPFFCITLFYFPILIKTGEEKLAIAANFGQDETAYYLWIVFLIRWSLTLQLITYPLFIYQQIYRYLERLGTQLNSQQNQQIKWILVFNSLFLIYGVMMLLYFLLLHWNIGGIEKDFYISAVMCFAIYSISFVGMVNPNLLKKIAFIDKIKITKYAHHRINKEEAQKILNLLESQMKQQQLFLNHDLNLHQVATIIQISRHLISQSLNSLLNKSFHQYVNELRIAYAINLLKTKSETDNLKTIMYASGFNNRASFNNNFKKVMGMTASEYLKKEVVN